MSGQNWADLSVAVVAVLGALAAWLRAQAAHARLNNLPQPPPPPPGKTP